PSSRVVPPRLDSAPWKLRPLEAPPSMFLLLLIAAVIAAAAYYHFQQTQKAGSGSKKKSEKNDVPMSCVSTANQPGTVTCAAGSVLPQSVTAVAKSADSYIPQKPTLTESSVNRIDAFPATTPDPAAVAAADAAAKPSHSTTSARSGKGTPSSGATPSKGSKKKKRSRRRKKGLSGSGTPAN
ncbi:hypothetical protein PENTCL1PPCAC_6060, partial [Pristionchus entomophagus]